VLGEATKKKTYSAPDQQFRTPPSLNLSGFTGSFEHFPLSVKSRSAKSLSGHRRKGPGGESEGLVELNLTETLIYLVAISLEINFLASSLRKTSEFDFYNQTQVYFYEILALQQGVFIFDE
jgi:hypothetical protein